MVAGEWTERGFLRPSMGLQEMRELKAQHSPARASLQSTQHDKQTMRANPQPSQNKENARHTVHLTRRGRKKLAAKIRRGLCWQTKSTVRYHSAPYQAPTNASPRYLAAAQIRPSALILDTLPFLAGPSASLFFSFFSSLISTCCVLVRSSCL